MDQAHRETVVALSSGAPPSGVAVIRLSGPAVRSVVECAAGSLPEPRRATLRTIRDRNGQPLDQGLVLFFPGPESFTGEDCAELQVHGGRAIITAILQDLSAYPGVRLAEAGEFTRRAFENGRIDLTEAEGLADLIAAQTEMQRRLALEQAKGGLTRLYADWAKRLLTARAMIEADLDFADEDDVPGSVADAVWADMAVLAGEIERHLAGGTVGERIRDGFRIVISGPPNAGKSSLLNALARRDVAIVSEEAGTTRDVIAVDMDIGGFAATLIDTAGLREAEGKVEREGIARARRAVQEADLVLDLREGHDPGFAEPVGRQSICVMTKGDLARPPANHLADVTISAVTGAGIDDLIGLIRSRLSEMLETSNLVLPTRLRHRVHLDKSLAFLNEAVNATASPIELRAEELRAAANELGRITGRTDVEDVLDVIFSSFCIGK